MIYELENKLSSIEVCKMMEVRHDVLLKKIDGINKDFNAHKIVVVKYWTEGTYQDVKGENRREFQITKKGCEFLAHKTTGTKGNLFTDKYMDKFAAMENVIKNNMPIDLGLANQMINLAQGTQVIGQVVQGLITTIGGIKEYVQDSIQAKDKQIDDIAAMVGLRTKNTRNLTEKLKSTLKEKYNMRSINSSMEVYKKAKSKIFKEFKVYKWEEISVTQYNAVEAFIENMFD